mmetsp:Transcript_8420/g.31058  ORF Transcript_8420/g.31058 Transcript_8420/m.31058 type:complete len:213 (-) Transcript_8420:360-998(-)
MHGGRGRRRLSKHSPADDGVLQASVMACAVLSCSLYVVLVKRTSQRTGMTSAGIMFTNALFSLLAMAACAIVGSVVHLYSPADAWALKGHLSISYTSWDMAQFGLATGGGFLLHLAIALNTTLNGPLMQTISGQLKSSTMSAIGLLFEDDQPRNVIACWPSSSSFPLTGCMGDYTILRLVGLLLNWAGSVVYAVNQYRLQALASQERHKKMQ